MLENPQNENSMPLSIPEFNTSDALVFDHLINKFSSDTVMINILIYGNVDVAGYSDDIINTEAIYILNSILNSFKYLLLVLSVLLHNHILYSITFHFESKTVWKAFTSEWQIASITQYAVGFYRVMDDNKNDALSRWYHITHPSPNILLGGWPVLLKPNKPWQGSIPTSIVVHKH